MLKVGYVTLIYDSTVKIMAVERQLREAEVYIVAKGDTCKNIAKKFKVKCGDLLKHNHIGKGYIPVVGQILVIPSCKGVTVIDVLNEHIASVTKCTEFLTIAINAVDKEGYTIPVIIVALSDKHKRAKICKRYELDPDYYKVDIKAKHYYIYDLAALEKFWSRRIDLTLIPIVTEESSTSQTEECSSSNRTATEDCTKETETCESSEDSISYCLRTTRLLTIREIQRGWDRPDPFDQCNQVCPPICNIQHCDDWSSVSTTEESSSC